MSDDSVMAMARPELPQNRPRVNWEINLGNVIQIGLIAFGIGWFVLKGDAKNEATATSVTNLERRVDSGFAAVDRRFDALAQTVSPISTLNSRLTEGERRLTEQDTRDNQQDARLNRIEQDVATMRGQLAVEARPGRRVVP